MKTIPDIMDSQAKISKENKVFVNSKTLSQEYVEGLENCFVNYIEEGETPKGKTFSNEARAGYQQAIKDLKAMAKERNIDL